MREALKEDMGIWLRVSQSKPWFAGNVVQFFQASGPARIVSGGMKRRDQMETEAETGGEEEAEGRGGNQERLV